jgi:hypothetical protein
MTNNPTPTEPTDVTRWNQSTAHVPITTMKSTTATICHEEELAARLSGFDGSGAR